MTLQSTEEQDLREYFSRLQSFLPPEIVGKVEFEHKSKKNVSHAYSSQESLKERLQNKIKELKSKRNSEKCNAKRIDRQKKHLKTKLKQVNATLPATPDSNRKSTGQSDSKKQNKKEFNKDNRVLYSKFDLIDRNEDPTLLTEHKKKKQDKRSKSKFGEIGALTGKNYKQLLKINQAKKDKLEALNETDPEKARALKDKDRWHTALLKAEGVKVKDDIQLLKKAAKRQDKKKKISKKRWDDRQATVEKDKEQRQLKRKENLNSRSEAKKKKKLIEP